MPLVPVPPLPDELPVAVGAMVPVVTVFDAVPVAAVDVVVVELVTGVPPPVSVAVVPVLEGRTVSVEGMELSADLRLHANAATSKAASRATKRSFFISKQQSGIAHMSLA